MFCSHCGKKVPDDSIFCIYCGQKITTNSINSPQNTTTSNAITNELLTEVFTKFSTCSDNQYLFICNDNTGLNEYNFSKYTILKENFPIKDQETIFLFFDDTTLKKCKYGIIVTANGIYYKTKNLFSKISWEEFLNIDIRVEPVHFYLGKFPIITDKQTAKTLYDIFHSLQEQVTKTLSTN